MKQYLASDQALAEENERLRERRWAWYRHLGAFLLVSLTFPALLLAGAVLLLVGVQVSMNWLTAACAQAGLGWSHVAAGVALLGFLVSLWVLRDGWKGSTSKRPLHPFRMWWSFPEGHTDGLRLKNIQSIWDLPALTTSYGQLKVLAFWQAPPPCQASEKSDKGKPAQLGVIIRMTLTTEDGREATNHLVLFAPPAERGGGHLAYRHGNWFNTVDMGNEHFIFAHGKGLVQQLNELLRQHKPSVHFGLTAEEARQWIEENAPEALRYSSPHNEDHALAEGGQVSLQALTWALNGTYGYVNYEKAAEVLWNSLNRTEADKDDDEDEE